MFKRRTQSLKGINAWLIFVTFMVFVMMLIGAVVRLTDSGLSIVEWRLVWGILPPMNGDEWQRIFSLYRETEQYRLKNAGMELSGFKTIFWWEYIHRVWGRLLAVIYIGGLFYLLLRKSVPWHLGSHFFMILLLGAAQAGLGWWMVNGALSYRIAVEPYRLMLHLGLAFILWGYLVWMLNLVRNELNWRYSEIAPRKLHMLTALLALATFAVVLLGALVAGLKGGLVHNDWPLMGGALFPADYFAPNFEWTWLGVLHNAIENPVAAQFHHRWLAFAILPMVATYRVYIERFKLNRKVIGSANMWLFFACLQVALGILTLVMQVPLIAAVLHQAGAALLFASALWHWRELRGLG